MTLNRRQLLNRSGVAGVGVVAATLGVTSTASADGRHGHGGHPKALFPPLQDDPKGLLALPAGFSYEVVAELGKTRLTGGGRTPERPDGTLVVANRGGYRLIQNHESSPGAENGVPVTPGTVYDEGVGATSGGCTVIDVTRSGKRVAEWVGLSGTISNCAGGPTPWGSWLTCEETETKAGGSLARDHGYVFEVFAAGSAHQSPLPIKPWGRAPHEAVVVEPSRRRVYLTEDASKPTGLLYRWTAPHGYRLAPRIAETFAGKDDAGSLEALVVYANDGSVLPDLSYVTSAEIGRPLRTGWKTVPDRQAASTSLRKQFADGEVTRSKKLEGAWGDADGMYFVASFAFAPGDYPADATAHDGQLWNYDYKSQTLTLVAYFPYNALLHDESAGWEERFGPSRDLAFDGPDGCHVSPYGSLVLTEDGNTFNHALAWSREHGAQAIARNMIVLEKGDAGGNVYSEMTGPCFSPDGKILFLNVQEPGHTFAVTGPWSRYL